MGKHKRKHSDVEVELAIENTAVPEIRKKSKKHKKSKERSPSPTHDDNQTEDSVSTSPRKSKKRTRQEKESLVEEVVHDNDDNHENYSLSHQKRVSLKPAKQLEWAQKEIDDPIAAKVLQDMKRGLYEATVGDPETLAAEELEAEDAEVFLIQCPENVNLSELLQGKKIRFCNGDVTTLTNDQDENYESVFIGLTDENEKTATIMLPDTIGNTRVVSTKLTSQIAIHEAIDDREILPLNVEEKPCHELPANLKERHPVFGTDFSIPLKSLECDSVDTHVHRKKSKKKSKKHKM